MAAFIPPGPFVALGTACNLQIIILIFRGKLHMAEIRIKLMLPCFISVQPLRKEIFFLKLTKLILLKGTTLTNCLKERIKRRERDRDKEVDLLIIEWNSLGQNEIQQFRIGHSRIRYSREELDRIRQNKIGWDRIT